MDIIWLKRDIRLHDHGPFGEVSKCTNPFCILYLYEPDQLSESTVHGSHIHFINEGLAELDRNISSLSSKTKNSSSSDKIINPYAKKKKVQSFQTYEKPLRSLTAVHGEYTSVLRSIHSQRRIKRILAHEETGHMASYERDKRVRKWCKAAGVQFVEYNQTGVTRGLQHRDEFSNRFQAFLTARQYDSLPCLDESRLVTDLNLQGRQKGLLSPKDLTEIPMEHRCDREHRQRGGEEEALSILESFLTDRGMRYSKGISSPNSAWTSCSRLSPYLSWGNISIRRVVQSVRWKQAQLKANNDNKQQQVRSRDDWSKCLSAFLSRMHWRSHFLQKLETEPAIEKRDLCPAYQPLRRQPNDWNESHYQAWSTGHTGYPFADACMRCLHKHGWINFRMRAMLVSFACYNLWLDWKRIAPHLGRLFLDYEPGIHYPQLQMQAGTTGINAMRVYSVAKQGRDQDPDGVFVKRYVPELKNVPKEFIHEPWKMSRKLQEKSGVMIGPPSNKNEKGDNTDMLYYPQPIVDEQKTAREAKEKVAMIRNLDSTKEMARQVYIKHGSRTQNEMNSKDNIRVSTAKKRRLDGQNTLISMFKNTTTNNDESTSHSLVERVNQDDEKRVHSTDVVEIVELIETNEGRKYLSPKKGMNPEKTALDHFSNDVANETKNLHREPTTINEYSTSWNCTSCTFENDKPLAPVCAMCGSTRRSSHLKC